MDPDTLLITDIGSELLSQIKAAKDRRYTAFAYSSMRCLLPQVLTPALP